MQNYWDRLHWKNICMYTHTYRHIYINISVMLNYDLLQERNLFQVSVKYDAQ